jgi:hypothetical protein
MGVAATVGPQRVRPGPRDRPMRDARVCYDHLAGDLAVAVLDGLLAQGVLVRENDEVRLGREAAAFFVPRGIDVATPSSRRRPVCRICLDWSVRRSHLSGALGAAILDKAFAEKWARRESGGRVVSFSPKGRRAFAGMFLAEQVLSQGTQPRTGLTVPA